MPSKRCQKCSPTQEKLVAQRDKLVAELAKIGLKPEDVPQAMKDLQSRIQDVLALMNLKEKKPA